MAVGIAQACTVLSGNMQLVIPSSGKGGWVIANDDAETAQSASDLLAPAAIDDDTFHWVRVADGATRVLIRGRIPVAGTVATDPVVRIIGAYGEPNSLGAFANDGTVQFLRLDNVDSSAAGLTIDMVSSAVGQMQDSVYAYSDVMPDLDGLDLKGAHYVGVAIETAAAVTASPDVCPIQLLFLN